MTAPLFLLSDFGLRDAFVGVMRARIAALAPRSSVHDLLHELPPQDLDAARIQLAAALPWLPDGAVLVAVVDPGVGGDRAGLAVRARRGDGATILTVAPDNGLLSPLLRPARRPFGADVRAEAAWILDRDALPPAGPGTTFDGRDLFAPAGARLARGDDPGALGRAVDPASLTVLDPPPLRRRGAGLDGRVVWIDRFGNLVTDLPQERLPDGGWSVRIAGRLVAGPAAAFAEVPRGEAVAYLGSLGTVEVALRDGDAAAAWGVPAGTPARLEPLGAALP